MHEMKELSKKNPDHISKKRYLELKNFCLQYSEWLRELPYDVTGLYKSKIELVDSAIVQLEEYIRPYIFEAVTTGKSYEVLNAYYQVPCCKQNYYAYYRKFFSYLSHSQDLHIML